jgi:hypothetical protein
MEKEKSVLKTIRIPESVSSALQKKADDEGTTVNAQINSIIRENVGWSSKAKKFGIATVPKSVFISLTEAVADEELDRIGREVALPAWKEMSEFWFQDSSPERIIDLLNLWSKFNPDFRTEITQKDRAYSIVLKHDFGPKWSILAKSAIHEFVTKTFQVEPKMSGGASVITARFRIDPKALPKSSVGRCQDCGKVGRLYRTPRGLRCMDCIKKANSGGLYFGSDASSTEKKKPASY